MQSTIRKHLSLAKVNSTMSIIINNWRMDPSLNALIHCETGETRRLGEYHFILLETLAKNADVVLSRSYLCAEVWKNRIVGGNSLPTAIHALRVAIDDDGKQQNIIKTIPKKGYLCNKVCVFAGVIACRSADYYRPDTGYSPRRDIFDNTVCAC